MKNNKGFTLIEIMVTVAIVGILVSVGLPAYQDYTIRAQVTEALSLTGDLKASVEEFHAKEGKYPELEEMDIDGRSGKYVENVNLEKNGVLTSSFGNSSNTKLKSAKLSLVPEFNEESGVMVWQCVSNAEQKYLPSSCQKVAMSSEPSIPKPTTPSKPVKPSQPDTGAVTPVEPSQPNEGTIENPNTPNEEVPTQPQEPVVEEPKPEEPKAEEPVDTNKDVVNADGSITHPDGSVTNKDGSIVNVNRTIALTERQKTYGQIASAFERYNNSVMNRYNIALAKLEIAESKLPAAQATWEDFKARGEKDQTVTWGQDYWQAKGAYENLLNDIRYTDLPYAVADLRYAIDEYGYRTQDYKNNVSQTLPADYPAVPKMPARLQ